jgi:hypothetical protein
MEKNFKPKIEVAKIERSDFENGNARFLQIR